MIRYAYELNNYRRWAGGFSKLLKATTAGGEIRIPAGVGMGYIRSGHLYAGITWFIMDIGLRDDLILFREKSSPSGLCLLFEAERDNNSFQLFSTGHDEERTYPREVRIKKAGLHFPSSFLNRYVRKDILTRLLHNEHQMLHIPFEQQRVFEDIFRTDIQSPLRHLILRNRLLLLTEKFLSSADTLTALSRSGNGAWAKGKQKDLEALHNVMNILCDGQLNKFPSIETLSKAASMSSTKLKSRFKQIYGMKLYEFYNRRRLEQAKEMLKSGNFSVREAGVNIGFSNLSNFAKAFKKEFGILPRQILKSK